MLGPGCSGRAVTEAGITVSQMLQHVVSLAKWAYDNGIRKVYTIVSDYAPGIDAENYFQKAFKAGGGEIVGSARTPQQETNFAVYMERALQAKPDAVYMFQPGGSPSISFVKAYVERGLKQAGIRIIATGDLTDDGVLNADPLTFHSDMAFCHTP